MMQAKKRDSWGSRLGIILMFRVFTLGTPDFSKPTWNVANGFGFLWNPDFSALKSEQMR